MDGGSAHLDDLVLGILHHLRAQGVHTFPADREQIHRAFRALKEAFPDVLASLRFRVKGMFPESLGLDQALVNLEASRLLHRKNLTPRYYEIDVALDESYDRFVEHRLEEAGVTRGRLQELAKRLHELTQVATAG